MNLKKYKKTKGFTLVELIVVITILAILWSIAFLSFQDFTAQARDSKRMTDISSLKKWLELYRTSSWDYPFPDSSNTISSSLWGVISYNWIIWKTVSNNVKLSETIKDPLTLADYKYSISGDKKEYEISYNLEDDSSVALVSQTFAELSEINRVDWNYSGIMTVASNWNYISAPGLIYDWISADTSITLWTTSASYLVDEEIWAVNFTPSLLANKRPKTEAEIKTVIDNIKTSYASAPVSIQNKKIISEVIAMDSSDIEDLNNFKDFYVEKRRSATSSTNKNSGGSFTPSIKLASNWVTVTCKWMNPWDTVQFNWESYWIAPDSSSDIEDKIFTEWFSASNICTSNSTDISRIFSWRSSFNEDISSWDTSNVEYMHWLFSDATSFNWDISNWDTSKVKDMTAMFRWASIFNSDISNWNTWEVQEMYWMFYEASSFNQDISSWNVSNVFNMSWMFWQAFDFNQDLSSWDVSGVSYMSNMFSWATSFNSDISGWDTSSSTGMHSMFDWASSFSQDLSNWCVTNISTAPNRFNVWAWALTPPVWWTCPSVTI